MSNDHYYTANPKSEHKKAIVTFTYRECALTFETDSGVFSRTELDRGSEILMNALPDPLTGKILDMGCGYGTIGIALKKRYPDIQITMSDINTRACNLARFNSMHNGVETTVLESDGYEAIHDSFDMIVQNPPIRAGKAVIYQMFADGSKCLKKGGSLWLVIRKQQGAASAIAYLKTLFSTVDTPEKKSGFWIIRCKEPFTLFDRKEDTES